MYVTLVVPKTKRVKYNVLTLKNPIKVLRGYDKAKFISPLEQSEFTFIDSSFKFSLEIFSIQFVNADTISYLNSKSIKQFCSMKN